MNTDDFCPGRFAVLLDGPVTLTDRLRTQVQGRRIIAADNGIRHSAALGIEPELWIGDFDSVTPDLATAHDDVERERFPSDKSLSDGALALERAMALGATDVVVCGATGGPRSDHVLFNLAQIATAGRGRNCKIWAANGHEEHHAMEGPADVTFDFAEDSTFSVFPIGHASGLTIKGARWPLDDVDVTFGSTQTLSNRVHARLSISLRSGSVFVIAQMEPN